MAYEVIVKAEFKEMFRSKRNRFYNRDREY